MSTRASAVLGVGVLLGLVTGLVIALLHPVRYRAEASVVVAPALKRTDPALSTMTNTVASIARSDAVAQNVATALHLGESAGSLRGDIGAHAHRGSALVTLTVDQSTALGAEQVLQQVAVVLQRLAASRLPGVVSGRLVVWDAPSGTAHALGRPYASWLVGGGSVGLLLACGALLAPGLWRHRNPRGTSEEPQRKPRGLARPKKVTSAGISPAVEAPPPPPPNVLEPVAAQGQSPRGTPEEPQRKEQGHLAELRRRIDAEPDAARQAEMQVYLDQLAPFAGPDGNLPDNLLGLAEDVFGPLA